MIYSKVLEKGYDMTKEPFPVYPCQHYLMGGINVDGKGATNIPGLYAAGECSHTWRDMEELSGEQLSAGGAGVLPVLSPRTSRRTAARTTASALSTR